MGNLVVVGVDGSSSSLSAVEAAVGEAQRRRAELRVVHAFSWPVRPMYAQLDPSPLNRLVHEAAQHAQSVAPEVEVTEAVVTGDAVAVLEAESRAADLVVVGSRGMGGFIGMLLGSTAVSLAAHGQCPVMVVREEQAGAGPIVLGVDGSPVGEKAVDFAFAEAALRGAEIVAVHAWLPDYAPLGTGPESPERLLAQALAGRTERYPDVRVRHDVVGGETREVLIAASKTAQLVWGLRLHLVCTLHGLPVTFALTGAKADERETLLDLLTVEPQLIDERPGQTLIGDKNYFGREFEQQLAELDIRLLRPARKGEAERAGSQLFKPLRQVIESINETFKGQLDLERHRGRTPAGVAVRVLQRILALTAAIWHNDHTGQPIMRALTAYDH